MNKVISNLVSGASKGAAATVKKAKAFVVNPRMGMLSMMLLFVSVSTFAQDVDAGLAAIETSTESLKRYVPVVTNLCYAIAGIVAMIGAISVYVKMNNEEQDAQEEHHDDCRCLYLPHRSSSVSAFVLWSLILGYE